MSPDKKKKAIRQKSRFFEQVALMNMLTILAMVLLSILLVLMIMPQDQEYYATSDAGDTSVALVAMTHPSLNEEFILRWAAVVAQQLYNFTFADVDQSLRKVRYKFTPSAYSSYKSVFDDSSLVSTVKSKQINVSSIVNGVPNMIWQGLFNNYYTWTLRMPLLINFDAGPISYNRRRLVRMTIKRVSPLDAPQSGMQISSLITTSSAAGSDNV